jgi:hypothetical protein
MAVTLIKLSIEIGISILFPGQGIALPAVVIGASRENAGSNKVSSANKVHIFVMKDFFGVMSQYI